MDTPPAPPSVPLAASIGGGEPPVFESTELFNGAVELLIRHEGRTYRLRRTRLGKLILTA